VRPPVLKVWDLPTFFRNNGSNESPEYEVPQKVPYKQSGEPIGNQSLFGSPFCADYDHDGDLGTIAISDFSNITLLWKIKGIQKNIVYQEGQPLKYKDEPIQLYSLYGNAN